jgi:hypothetical protein
VAADTDRYATVLPPTTPPADDGGDDVFAAPFVDAIATAGGLASG